MSGGELLACAYCGALAVACVDIGGDVGMPRCGAQRCRDRWWDDRDAVGDLVWRWWVRGERTQPTHEHRRAVRDAIGSDAWIPYGETMR